MGPHRSPLLQCLRGDAPPPARPSPLRGRAPGSGRRAPAIAAVSTLSRARAVAAAALVLGLGSFAALSWAQQQQQQPQFDLGAAVPQGDSAYRAGSGGLGIGASLMRLPLLGGTLTGGTGGATSIGGAPSAGRAGGSGGGLVGGSLGGSLAGNSPGSRTGAGSNALFGGGGVGLGAGAGPAAGGANVAGGGSLTSWAAGVEGAVAQMRQDASLAADSAMGRAAQLANSTAATLQRLRQDGAGALLMPVGAPSAAVPAAAERLAESAGRGGASGGAPQRIQWQWSQDDCGSCPAEAQPVCCRQRVTYRNACKAVACHNELPASCVPGRCDNGTAVPPPSRAASETAADTAAVSSSSSATPASSSNSTDSATAAPVPAGNSGDGTAPNAVSGGAGVFTSSRSSSNSNSGPQPAAAPPAAAAPEASSGPDTASTSGDGPATAASTSTDTTSATSTSTPAGSAIPSSSPSGAATPSSPGGGDKDTAAYTYSSDPSGVCGCVGELAAGGPLCCGGRAYSNTCAAQCLGEQPEQCTPGWCGGRAPVMMAQSSSSEAPMQPARGVFRPLLPRVEPLPAFAAATATATATANAGGGGGANAQPAASSAAPGTAAPAAAPEPQPEAQPQLQPQQPVAVPAPQAPQSCDCVPMWAPVCCGGRTYMNSCSARCAGGVKDIGTCVAGVTCSAAAAADPEAEAEGVAGSGAGADVAGVQQGAGAAGPALLPVVTVQPAGPFNDVQQKK
ncbi:hypothetical protein HYH02_014711 [Chlamydomonas schloesseri]|uniref:Kazal-like domain-containing protein n=1 Tax=Chlamydomonas schloesseri TaxID=2026947 RepID=A0A835SNL5_9CHLO|nr:hypothetical protein HYH02_014711 [Chlamydomonas schloesseri]|eukprot:KAG2426858.1 hypothetical protein HYH02_014711 [Chlamydomonas schloesseri]